MIRVSGVECPYFVTRACKVAVAGDEGVIEGASTLFDVELENSIHRGEGGVLA